MLDAVTLDMLGMARHRSGNHQGAIECLHKAVAIGRRMADRMIEAIPLGNLGLVYKGLGDYRAALECHEQARALFAILGDQTREQIEADHIRRLLGELTN